MRGLWGSHGKKRGALGCQQQKYDLQPWVVVNFTVGEKLGLKCEIKGELNLGGISEKLQRVDFSPF